MALPQTRLVRLLLLFLYKFSTFAASLESNISSLSNVFSSSDGAKLLTVNISSNNLEYADCFNPATPRGGLYPAAEQDCLKAAQGLFYYEKNPFRPTTFGRGQNVGFMLPQVFRNGTCGISIDVMNDADRDIFKPWVAYNIAVDIAHRCTRDAYRFGGRSRAGPKMLVDVLVFGRVWPPLENGVVEPATLERAVVVAKERLASGDSGLLNETSLNLTKPSVPNATSLDKGMGLNAPDLGRALECFDPPLPRERAWRINVKDCEIASDAISGDRERGQKYTFSREPVATEFYYPLPATFRYRSCVVLLDMNNNNDQDTVRLSIVEATAWVLAHKCSGEERSVDQYGGQATVGVGAKHLINVWVYGKALSRYSEV